MRVWAHWLRFMGDQLQYTSPGVSNSVKRKHELTLKYTNLLSEERSKMKEGEMIFRS